MLLYAEDTVILADKASELQNALDAMSEYCTLWVLKVNTAKTKIVVFCKNKQSCKNLDPFLYEGSQLELIDNFAYLGVQFSFNGKFLKTKKKLVDQARKAMFSVLQTARKLYLPVEVQLNLFDTMVAPILLYGLEVWGFENVDIINRFQLKFVKIVLGLKQTTPSCMVYGELGLLPLSTQIKSRVLNYWCKVLNDKENKISVLLYKMSKILYTESQLNFPWLRCVHNSLNSLGLSNYWLNQTVTSPTVFKKVVNQRIRDQFIQEWHSTVHESSKCLNYRTFKTSFDLSSISLIYHLIS